MNVLDFELEIRTAINMINSFIENFNTYGDCNIYCYINCNVGKLFKKLDRKENEENIIDEIIIDEMVERCVTDKVLSDDIEKVV